MKVGMRPNGYECSICETCYIAIGAGTIAFFSYCPEKSLTVEDCVSIMCGQFQMCYRAQCEFLVNSTLPFRRQAYYRTKKDCCRTT